ncbi:hypothetical protein P872_14160 [Rhodonellum psychrophilum GCM71 = DSM 17998]|uniref:NodB homology domain-containing protein n=2 Tax=Rhodonellum TaxID=336827 RepID=U5BW62_9BACT|nr:MULTISPECIES: polysaccharide deacetylase family protein [Rhodonellum]ERM80182.1 hypothetical protein P872_14160 [Rhodonellum psychrophilum GCM71 = DSM 17998]
MTPPVFTISLDFELLWGIFDKVGNNVNKEYFLKTRKVIPQLLELFAQNEIQVTWATVGMLFAENEEEWHHYSPLHKPSYRNKNYSAYEWKKQHGLEPDLHFAPDLIKRILETPGQEIGSHTFAHFYTLIRGQSPDQFRMDLQAAQKIAGEKFGIQLKSLVFPRNHLNHQYLAICGEEGFDQVRGNPKNWFWQETQHGSLLKRLSRTADCFVPMGSQTSYPWEEVEKEGESEPWMMPASRLLRPYYGSNNLINTLRLNRIFQEMTHSAKHGQIYHLWWHPHNFGHYPEDSMRELSKILQHFHKLKSRYGMLSLSMKELGTLKTVHSQQTEIIPSQKTEIISVK